MSPPHSPDPPFLVHCGVLRPAGEGVVAATDGLASCGRGAFETIAAYRGRPFLAEAHLARLRRAAAALGLPCLDDAVLLASIDAALEANGLLDLEKARVRLTLSSPADGSANWWVEATPPPPHPATARLVTGPFFRNERSPLAGLKTINYGENIVAQRLAAAAGADEALFANTRDELCEGTWSNVFVRAGDRWITPPLASGCLPGVTRALVLELSRKLGTGIAEETFHLRRAAEIDAAFLTSSLREIQPVSAIDGRELAIPPLVPELSRLYRRQAGGT